MLTNPQRKIPIYPPLPFESWSNIGPPRIFAIPNFPNRESAGTRGLWNMEMAAVPGFEGGPPAIVVPVRRANYVVEFWWRNYCPRHRAALPIFTIDFFPIAQSSIVRSIDPPPFFLFFSFFPPNVNRRASNSMLKRPISRLVLLHCGSRLRFISIFNPNPLIDDVAW